MCHLTKCTLFTVQWDTKRRSTYFSHQRLRSLSLPFASVGLLFVANVNCVYATWWCISILSHKHTQRTTNKEEAQVIAVRFYIFYFVLNFPYSHSRFLSLSLSYFLPAAIFRLFFLHKFSFIELEFFSCDSPPPSISDVNCERIKGESLCVNQIHLSKPIEEKPLILECIM